jgi:hypothetical protein
LVDVYIISSGFFSSIGSKIGEFMKRFGTFFVIIVLLLSATVLFSTQIAGEGTRNGDPITKFKSGVSEILITYNSPGSDTSARIEIPTDTRITSASLDAEGILNDVYNVEIKDHTDTQNLAWSGASGTKPFQDTITGLKSKGTAFSSSDYMNVKALDSTRFSYTASGSYPYTLHQIKVPVTGIDEFEPFAAGYAWGADSSMSGDLNFFLYIYNYTASNWELVDGLNVSTQARPAGNMHLSKTYTSGYSNFVDANNLAHLLVTTSNLYMYTMFELDYVSINTTVVDSSHPTDVTLDIGNDGDDDWSQTGELNGISTITGPAIISEFQSLVDAEENPNVVITLNITTASVGKIRLKNLNIGIYQNDPPELDMEVSNLVSFPEDGDGSKLVNVLDHFVDDHDTVFRFDIEHQGGESIICTKNPDGNHLDFAAPENWYGYEEFRIKAYDTGLDAVADTPDDEFVYSNWFRVTVSPTDDAPTVDKVNDVIVNLETVPLTGYEDQYLNISVQASDIDGDEIVYTSDSELFPINSETGLISVIPTQADVGVHMVNIVATENNFSVPEAELLYDSVNLEITVLAVNDGPSITAFMSGKGSRTYYKPGSTVLACREDELSSWTIEYTDPEDDDCTFTTDFSNPRFDLDQDEGTMTFSPLQEDVGDHLLTITISDSDLESQAEVTISVGDVNDAPEINEIQYSNGEDPYTFDFDTEEAYDEDGDDLTYTWNFGDDQSGEGMSVSHTYAEDGDYTVELTVSDGRDSATTSVVVTVSAGSEVVDDDDDDVDTPDDDVIADDDDVVDPDDDDNADDDDDEIGGSGTTSKKSSLLWWLIPLIIILAVLVILAIVVIVVVKKRKKDESQPEPLPMPMEPTPLPPAAAPAPQPQQQPYTNPQPDLYAQQAPPPQTDIYAQPQPDPYAQAAPPDYPPQDDELLPEPYLPPVTEQQPLPPQEQPMGELPAHEPPPNQGPEFGTPPPPEEVV